MLLSFEKHKKWKIKIERISEGCQFTLLGPRGGEYSVVLNKEESQLLVNYLQQYLDKVNFHYRFVPPCMYSDEITFENSYGDIIVVPGIGLNSKIMLSNKKALSLRFFTNKSNYNLKFYLNKEEIKEWIDYLELLMNIKADPKHKTQELNVHTHL